MRALFLTANLGGNVPPTMAIAQELCRRGIEVEIAGLAAAEPAGGRGSDAYPVAVDARWAAGRDASGRWEPPGTRQAGIFLSRRFAADAERLVHDRRADIVVVDCMALALIAGSQRTGIPVVVLLHTFGEFWRRAALHGLVSGLLRGLGHSPRLLWGAAALRLLLTDRELDPASGAPELAGYAWTGTTEVGVAAPASASRLPRVIVSFSSTPLAGMRAVYWRAIDALAGLPVEVIVTTGSCDIQGSRPRTVPANVTIEGFVPHSEIFPGAALVIGHGGHSTTMKALAHGIPLIVLPLNPNADQSLNGDLIAAEGLGAKLSPRSDPAMLRRTVEDMLADAALRERAAATGARLRSAPPGAAVAADRILALARA